MRARTPSFDGVIWSVFPYLRKVWPRKVNPCLIWVIWVFSSEREVARTNETVRLNIRARDPLDRPLWYRLSVDQGELLVEDEEVRFLCATPTRAEISLCAVNENGFVAHTTTGIVVE